VVIQSERSASTTASISSCSMRGGEKSRNVVRRGDRFEDGAPVWDRALLDPTAAEMVPRGSLGSAAGRAPGLASAVWSEESSRSGTGGSCAVRLSAYGSIDVLRRCTTAMRHLVGVTREASLVPPAAAMIMRLPERVKRENPMHSDVKMSCGTVVACSETSDRLLVWLGRCSPLHVARAGGSGA
jgi:hypothetical protein